MTEQNPQLEDLLDRMEELLAAADGFEPEVRDQVFELLDGVDAVHRHALTRLGAALGDQLDPIRAADPATDWLFRAYGVGVEDLQAASEALEDIRPYIHEHGGEVEALSIENGIVQVQLSGACSGCTSSAVTLREGVEQALRDGLPGFVAMEVVEAEPDAAPHPPPGPTLLQIQPRPA
ncbi:MAG: NifU family protein [Actinomycetota bacterium]|nr:NifU family protein [Actinomycetota bacterium]